MRYAFSILFLLLIASSVLAAAPQMKLNIQWEYKEFPGRVDIYEIKGKPRLWQTNSVGHLKDAPIGERIQNSALLMTTGQTKRFVLIIQNPTEKPLFFFAAPHVAHPVEHSLGLKLKCLCINHAFTIGPKETWYRVVEVHLSGEFVGHELTITHSIVGIDQKRADSFSKKSE